MDQWTACLGVVMLFQGNLFLLCHDWPHDSNDSSGIVKRKRYNIVLSVKPALRAMSTTLIRYWYPVATTHFTKTRPSQVACWHCLTETECQQIGIWCVKLSDFCISRSAIIRFENIGSLSNETVLLSDDIKIRLQLLKRKGGQKSEIM